MLILTGMVISSSSILLLPMSQTMLVRQFMSALLFVRSHWAAHSPSAVPTCILEVFVVLSVVVRTGRALVRAVGKEYKVGHIAVGKGLIWGQI